MQYSSYQQNIFEIFENTNDNLCVQAGPGSGKTTLLVELANRIPRYKKAIFLAFNKKIVEELKTKLPSNVDCYTLHSFGYRVLLRHIQSKIKLSQYKIVQLSDPIVKKLNLDDNDEFKYKIAIQSIIDFARITKAPQTKEGFESIVDNYDILCDNGEVENSLQVYDVLKGYNKGKHEEFLIDFIDMLYLPLFLNMRVPQYDIVAIDELQDLNPLQHELLNKIVKRNGRICGVGDKKQSICAFSGADIYSISNFQKKFKTINLPLSISYRLPLSGVKHAQQLNSDLEPNEIAIEGELILDGKIEDIQHGDFVVCRNVRPLIDLHFMLIEQEKRATIVGRDIEKGLLNVVKGLEGDNLGLHESIQALNAEKQHIIETLKNKGIRDPLNHFKYVNFEEKANIVILFLRKYDYISVVKQKIKDIFHNDDKKAIKLMTIHKAKGLEADNVFYLSHYDGKKLIPSKYAVTKEQLQQERNLDFVARTRHKKKLAYIKL